MTEVNVAEVSEITGESESEVMRRGLKSYISREIREANVRLKELKQKYGARDSDELREMIDSGEVEEHPAWEDLIEWKNLEKRVEKLKRY